MAGKSATPLVLGAGALALIMMGGKRKKKTSSSGSDGVYTPEYGGDGGDGAVPYIPPTPQKKSDSTPSRPSGNPPRGSDYDDSYWGSNLDEQLISIRQHFASLGYPVEIGPWPMNILGPKGSVELENIDGTKGKLGGGDDKPDSIVRKFQREYNLVSRLNKAEKIFSQSLGGLDEDGFVGPYVLNALRYLKEAMPGGKTWPDLLLTAANKGIS